MTFRHHKSIISVLGAGAWGTAFAVHLARSFPDRKVYLWTRSVEGAERLRADRVNKRYLPDVLLPSSLHPTSDLAQIMGSELLILAIPSRALTDLRYALEQYKERPPIILLTKGFDHTEMQDIPRLLFDAWSSWPADVMVLSGPNFAAEIAAGLPAASTLAAATLNISEYWVEQLHSANLRLYASDDRIGVSLGGAVKNVLAIAAGLSDGLHLGYNARATLITRSLSELMQLARKMGGYSETLFGLSGLGDMLLTCTGDLSRNRQVGLQLAAGNTLENILGKLGHVAEGVYAAKAVMRLADYHECEMPICRVVFEVLEGRMSPQAAVDELLSRSPKPEWVSDSLD